MQEKTCTRCGESKPLDAFWKRKTTDGHTSKCGDCESAKKREHTATAFGGICKSWPHCHEQALPNDRFCAKHRSHLDRVKSQPRPKQSRSKSIPKAAPVKVTKIPRAGGIFKEKILSALANGPLSGEALGELVGSSTKNRTYSRTRRKLVDEGTIEHTTGEPSKRVYQLAAKP